MNVVKGEKKDWRKGDELYTNWEPRLWKTLFSRAVATTTADAVVNSQFTQF
jgi:hypothetical protein